MAKLLGIISLIAIIGCILNFCAKRMNAYVRKNPNVSDSIKSLNGMSLKLFVRYHSFWGYLAVGTMLIHSAIFIMQNGIEWWGMTGSIALALQGIVGYALRKRPNRKLLLVHQGLTIILLVVVTVHANIAGAWKHTHRIM